MRAMIMALAVVAFAAVTADAQTPNARVFNGGAGLILYTIKPGSTADFEMVLNKTKEALAKSEKPDRKQQAASWRVYKSDQAAANGNVTYTLTLANAGNVAQAVSATRMCAGSDRFRQLQQLADELVGIWCVEDGLR